MVKSENQYKASYYNFLFENDNKTILYNSCTGALSRLKESDKENVMNILKTPNNIKLKEKMLKFGIWHWQMDIL